MKKFIMKSSINSNEKTASAKKLVQARLSFKILSSSTSGTSGKVKDMQAFENDTTTIEKDVRKRKLSTESNLPASKILCTSKLKENLSKDIVFISDDESIDKDLKEKDILSNSDDKKSYNNRKVKSKKTPNLKSNEDVHKPVSKCQSTPFTIKLPMSSKRRRNLSQKLGKTSTKNVDQSTLLEDEGKTFKKNLDQFTVLEDENVVKRFKVHSEEARDGKESDVAIEIKDNEITLSDDICLQVTASQDSTIDSKKKEETLQQRSDEMTKLELHSDSKISEEFKLPQLKPDQCHSTEEIVKLNDFEIEIAEDLNDINKTVKISKLSDFKSFKINERVEDRMSECKKEEEEEKISHDNEITERNRKGDSDDSNDVDSNTPSKNTTKNLKLQNKILTPKQKLKQKEREERQKQKELEKLEKQKEKEEKERLRKKEREEKEEQRRKEREEKEEQKRKEKEEKEKKKLAEVEVKIEERRLKEEERKRKEQLKEEERRKKEEEKKRKDQEKEEAENKKKKAAEAFTKFFLQKQQKMSTRDLEEEQNSEDSDKFKNPTFMPFQIKGHMKLAPIFRRILDATSKEKLDKILNNQLTPEEDLYLHCLKSGKVCPAKETKTCLLEDENTISNCLLIEDELGSGQAIVEVNKPVQKYRAKFLYFDENRRPPYYGTWRKKSRCIKPRRPFALDKIFFDYEIDSDDEWEEEEPGESLHGSDDEKESEDDYEVDNDFFVPHGHLSDEELQNEDEMEDENTPEMQKAKLKLLQQQFAQEMKKKTEKINPRLVGPLWQDENGNQPALCPESIWLSLNKRAMILTNPLLMVEPEKVELETVSPSQEKKIKKTQLNESQIKDLIKLVHGNIHNKKFMIKEFHAFLTKQTSMAETGSVEYQKSTIREQIDKIAEWTVIEDKVKKKKRLCWLVLPHVLKEYNLEELSDNNKWEYTLKPKTKKTSINTSSKEEGKSILHTKKKKKDFFDITTFTTSVSKEIDKMPNVRKKETQLQCAPETGISNIEKELNSYVEDIKKENKVTFNILVPKCSEKKSSTVVKKRVPLLMSVPRGQAIPESTKNVLISDFLKRNSNSRSFVSNSEFIESVNDDVFVIE